MHRPQRTTGEVQRTACIAALWLSLASQIGAQPLPVVLDAGPGVPIGALLAPVLAPQERSGASPLVQFPVRTPGLVPGRLAGQPRWPDAQWLTQPVFLIGSDAGSRRWLQQHRHQLVEMQAAGLVVQAPDDAAFQRLRGLGDGLTLAPAPAPWLAQRLAALHAAVLPLLMLPDGTLTQRPDRADGPSGSDAEDQP
jgi:integrating conjugative element protein (TIGR03765 family)